MQMPSGGGVHSIIFTPPLTPLAVWGPDAPSAARRWGPEPHKMCELQTLVMVSQFLDPKRHGFHVHIASNKMAQYGFLNIT